MLIKRLKLSSKSILVRRGRRELCKPGRSQSFGRGWLSFSTPVLARALFSFTSVSLVVLASMVWQIQGIPIGGVMSSAAVAFSSLGQHRSISRLGFNFQGRRSAVVSHGGDVWTMCLWVAAYFVAAAFLFLFTPATQCHSR